MFDHFVGLALKVLRNNSRETYPLDSSNSCGLKFVWNTVRSMDCDRLLLFLRGFREEILMSRQVLVAF